MTDNEKIQSFGDMVDAVEKLTNPIHEENKRLHKQLFWERVIFGILLLSFIAFAYLTPVDMEQGQQFDEHTQSQSYSEGFTNGK